MHEEYPPIDTIWKRDMANKGRIIVSDYARPEFAYLAQNVWVGTEKVDGTNVRVGWEPERGLPTFGGRTDNAQLPTPLIACLQELFTALDIDKLLPKALGAPLTLYGEGYGAKIQKGGGNYLPHAGFVLFDVRVGEWWLERENVEAVAEALDLSTVPIVFRGTLGEACSLVRTGLQSEWGAFPAEGLVLRPRVELQTRSGERIITKIKHRDYQDYQALRA